MTTHTWKPDASGYVFGNANYTDGSPFVAGDTIDFSSGAPSAATVYAPGQPPAAAILPPCTLNFTPTGSTFTTFTLQNVGLGAGDTVNVLAGTQELDLAVGGSCGNRGAINVGTGGRLEISIDGITGAPLQQQGSFLNSGTLNVAAGGGIGISYFGVVFGDGSINSFDNTGVINVAAGARFAWNQGFGGDVGSQDGYFRAGGTINIDGASGATTRMLVGAEEFGSGRFIVNGGTDRVAGDTALDFGDQVIGAQVSLTDGEVEFDAAASGTVAFQGDSVALITAAAPDLVGFGETLSGFGAGDLLAIDNIVETSLSYASSSGLLSVLDNGLAVATIKLAGSYSTGSFTATNVTSTLHGKNVTQVSITANEAPCFCSGTMIATADGPRAVERLQVGDLVLARQGSDWGLQPVRWLGQRRLQVSRHPEPERVRPVRILRDAIAAGMPHRDVLLSPDHAVFLDGMLIQARQLVNDATVHRDTDLDQVTYHHVELDRHAILLADGLPCESYLDTGNRHQFAAGAAGAAPLALHADFARSEHPAACAPLVTDGERVRPVWQRLADRAARLGHVLPRRQDVIAAPALQLLLPDGRSLGPERVHDDGRHVFWIGTAGHPGADRLRPRLRSAHAAPADVRPWLDDRRRLGVAVGGIEIWTRSGGLTPSLLRLEDATGCAGWWPIEADADRAWRWTDGDALLDLPGDCVRVDLRLLASAERLADRRQDIGGDAAAALRCA